MNVSVIPNEAWLITMSRAFSIYKPLRILFECDEQASTWVHKSNIIFDTDAIDKKQTIRDLEEAQIYLRTKTN